MSAASPRPIAVLGAGSFGTSLAQHLARTGATVNLWAHRPELADELQTLRENRRYHPGVTLHPGIRATGDAAVALSQAALVVSVVPSHVTRETLLALRGSLEPDAIVVCATKGIEVETQALMSDVFDQVLPEPNRDRVAFLSGPSFAKELMQNLPTAVTVAARESAPAEAVQQAFRSDRFRAYTTHDVVGVEVAGAVKNVMAIAAGIGDGLSFGHNTRAALITRGLAEMARMGTRLGADPMTFMGLAGMGDLVLTCTGDLSRNRSVGLKLGQGQSLEEILAQTTQVAEGVKTTRAVQLLCQRLGVEMPIVEAVHAILYEGKNARLAVTELMTRPPRRELE